jgi:hypothetical protein
LVDLHQRPFPECKEKNPTGHISGIFKVGFILKIANFRAFEEGKEFSKISNYLQVSKSL